jgi:NAD(P)H-dependent FMN reductase
MTIVALSGSLRRCSVNTAALRAAASAAAREGVSMVVDDSLRGLPLFDPDLEQDPPAAVREFRARLEAADAVLVAVPEYMFGIPGAFKNALDWTTASGSLYRKPVTVLSVAPSGRGSHVLRSLELVLTALDADAVYHRVPVKNADRDGDCEIASPGVIRALEGVAAALAERAQGGGES